MLDDDDFADSKWLVSESSGTRKTGKAPLLLLSKEKELNG